MNELQSLSMIFQNKLFRIPDYQRGYAWQEFQLIDFWEDLVNLQPDRNHYTGLLSIKQLSREDSKKLGENDQWLLNAGYKAYHIVDGQQRLTTFVILLHELIKFCTNLDENKSIPESDVYLGFEAIKDIRAKYISKQMPPNNLRTTYIFGYENDNPSADYLRYKIFEEKFGGTLKETYYTKNLKFAKTFFEEALSKFYEQKGTQGLSDLYQKLTLHLMFNIHEIEDDYDVYVAFETMNNRGKRLTNLELLKNRLIYLTTLYNKEDLNEENENALRETINNAWKEVYFQLGRNEFSPLSDDEFLRAHWIIYFKYTRQKGDDYIKFLLRKFSHKSIFNDVYEVTSDSQDPVIIENENIEDEENETDDNDISEEINEDSQQTEFLRPSMIADYVNSLKECSESWYYTFFPDESTDLSEQEKLWIDRLNRIGIGYFRPLVSVIINKSTSGTSEDKVEVLKAIERFQFINFRLAQYQSSYKSNEYYNKARDLYFGRIPLQEIAEDLNETTNNNTENALETFVSKMHRRFDSDEGFYSWHDLKYFLFEYEYSLAEKLKRLDNLKLDWISFTSVTKGKYSIEHILPQTPKKLYWRNNFRQFTSSEIKKLTGSLGNMLPLSQAVNSSLQNDTFDEKKKRGYSNGSYCELEVAKEKDWTADRIYNRGLMLLDFMETRWDFKFANQQQKEDLLYISFVNDQREIPPEITQESIAQVNDDIEIGASRHEKRKAYWTYLLPILRANLNGPYGNVNPTKSNSLDGFFGVSGIHLYCNISMKLNKVSVGFWIDTGDSITSKKIFDLIYKDKEYIEDKIGLKLDWDRKDASRSCSINATLNDVDFTDKEQWPKLAEFQSKYAKLLADIVFYPREDEIKRIIRS
ncbi:DUF4268 domain-containing protein [Treponema bryantii]|uniref:DUF4268 domain-containing protein n=1 Tax=Treponema bryantii TaxID=163 RepID=UPI0003B4113C|nr:DUF4268 domain-containing protein [Treponema bryantii]